MTETQADTVAGLQRANAKLWRERDAALSEKATLGEELAARTAELEQRNTEYSERIGHQAATTDVLKVISASPGDPQPVFDLIVERARDLCDGYGAAVYGFDGTLIHWRAATGVGDDASVREAVEAMYPMAPSREWPVGRAIMDGQIVRIGDLETEPGLNPAMRGITAKSSLVIPLMRGDVAIGALALGRRQRGGFSGTQIELLKTFAEQAVIAIRSAETYRALQERTQALARRNSEYGERIEQQAATIDVLKAMSASPADSRPVFELIVDRARAFCGADHATTALVCDDMLHLQAFSGMNAEYVKEYVSRFPRPVDSSTMFGRAILSRETMQAPYVQADPALFASQIASFADFHTIVGVPMLRGGEPIGAIALGRRAPGGFSEMQIELLKTFAEQAVIAVASAETYRNLNQRSADLQQSLEYQTATSEVLNVISRSTFDLEPVFQTVAATAVRLCNADQAGIYLHQNHEYRWAGGYSQLPEYERIEREVRIGPGNGTLVGRVALQGRPVQILDAWTDTLYQAKEDARVGAIHTLLGVPLLRDGSPIGVIGLGRQRIEPFSERQIELVSTFAAQAVIAMENARLITETREALEQQTATAEVLQVINASPGNLVPVLDAILNKAHALCGATVGNLTVYKDGYFQALATHGLPEEIASMLRQPFLPNPTSQGLIDGARFHQIEDIRAIEINSQGPITRALVAQTDVRTVLFVPLRKDGALLGFISAHRPEVRPFSEKEITLLENFAAQAVIAMENARLLTEQREALEQQTATAEVLQVINASPGDLTPVFDAMLEKAMRLCEAGFGSLYTYDGDGFQSAAQRGVSAAYAAYRERHPPELVGAVGLEEVFRARRVVQVTDMTAERSYLDGNPNFRAMVDLGGMRTAMVVPLCKDETVLGVISIFRQEVRPFSDKQIALLENFAAQAVIAMENARLITEQREALEQQTAIADVLRAINATPGDLAPVFDVIGGRAIKLCDAAAGALMLPDGDRFRAVALGGVPEAYAEFCRNSPAYGRPNPGSLPARMLAGEDVVHIKDITDVDEYAPANTPSARALAELGGGRTLLGVALRKDDKFFGMITIFRQAVRPFSDRQVVLLQSFADQAVIAMENARLLEEVRQRQEELRITFENMGDGVAMFDETQHLVAWNRKFQDILDVPDDIIARRQTFSEYVHYLAERGEYGPEADPKEHVRRLIEEAGQSRTYERTRPDGRVIEIRHNPVPGGGFVLIFSDITERKRNETELRAARDAAEEASRTIEAAYRELKAAQASLIQAEKMASLGQLTAGIAHEIKNPLNFVNNFSDLSVDLLNELQDAVAPGKLNVADSLRAEIDDVTSTLKGNLEKIAEHGRRADSIVRNMLLHSRTGPSEHRAIDVNTTVEEALNLAYHGARAETPGFNVTMDKDLDPKAGSIDAFPQEFLRVMLNLISNGFYAARKRANAIEDTSFEPTLHVTTRNLGSKVEIRVRDNGAGIGKEVRDKIFEPFFTTKPAGEGTGLGLSLSYDIIVKQHGGQLTVDSRPNDFTEFQITLPRRMAANEGGRA